MAVVLPMAAGQIISLIDRLNLFGYMQIRGWRTYSCELVTEIAVKRFKPGWKFYRRLSLSIEYYSPVVDILPVWRFNK